MIVTAKDMENNGKSLLDRVSKTGETVEIQQDGKTVAEINRRVGVKRSEFIRLMQGRGFTETDSKELKQAMDTAAEVFGYTGGN